LSRRYRLGLIICGLGFIASSSIAVPKMSFDILLNDYGEGQNILLLAYESRSLNASATFGVEKTIRT
jgi:hypothetical protein